MISVKSLQGKLQTALSDLGLGSELSELVQTRRNLRRMTRLVTADERDVRIWFTGLNEVFEGSHLEDYPEGYKQAIQAPWPQPSPHAPSELPPSVLHVPEAEVTEFLKQVVARYVSTLKSDWIDALVFAHRRGKLREMSDARFAEVFLTSPMGKSLTPVLEADDQEFLSLFALENQIQGSVWKVDFSLVEGIELLPQMSLEPTVAYFLREGHSSRMKPLAIRVRQAGFLPTSSRSDQGEQGDKYQLIRSRAAWVTAKQMTLQAAAVTLIASAHPVVHFPMDAINAITKTVLAVGHPLREMLLPHCYMQLPLNFAVLYIDRSVAHNHQREIYSAFPTTRRGFFELMKRGYSGYQGRPTFPHYQFKLGSPSIPTPYGDFLNQYYQPILNFARTVCSGLDSRDAEVRRWWESLYRVLPGVPSPPLADEPLDLEQVAQIAATFVHNCAVVHSADHHCYAKLPIDQVPLRMRVGADDMISSGGFVLPKEKIRKSDLFRHRMAWKMYFRPTTIRALPDVDYAFSDPLHRDAARKFHADLRQLDRSLDGEKYIHLSQIASSIQY